MKDYYEILDVIPGATQAQIRDQYRFLLHAWHPDKFATPEQKRKAEEKVKEINEAYAVLGNAARLAQYDKEQASSDSAFRKDTEARGSEEQPKNKGESRPGNQSTTQQQTSKPEQQREPQRKSLIRPWMVLLALIALCGMSLIALCVMIFRPTIDDFRADRAKVLARDPVTLSWRASPFADLRIDQTIGSVPGPAGSKVVAPTEARTVYRLTAENILTRINAQWFGATRDVIVEVVPVLPVISFAMVMPDGKRIEAPFSNALPIMRGEKVTLYWEARSADTLLLSTNGASETIPPAELIGKRTLAPDADTVYSLEARNQYGDDKKLLAVKVNVPPTKTPTLRAPIPLPIIVRFDISPQIITAGETIKIEWEVQNADTVVIQGVDGPNQFPPKGSINQSPDRSTAYVLTAINGPNVIPMQRDVTVNPAPTPTIPPVK